MKWDVACLGDLVMDLVPHSQSGGEWLYVPSPGGAPGNVAAGLARLGKRPVMIAKVGADGFGQLISGALDKYGVDTSGLSVTDAGKTRLSVVTIDAQGDRSFTFYKDNPADALLSVDDINPSIISGARLLHIGSLLMASPIASKAQDRAIDLARSLGTPVSVDPNFRPSLWTSHDEMVAAGHSLVARSQIVKLSEEELRFLAGPGEAGEAVRSLWHEQLKFLAVTMGARGAELFTGRLRIACHGFSVAAIDTLAAGDAFMASLLSGLLDIGFDTGNETALEHILRRACAAGALATMTNGAMASLPHAARITRLLDTVSENAPQPE